MNITQQEVSKVLKQLGFVELAKNGNSFKFTHKKSGAEVELGTAQTIYTPYLAGIATILEGYGIIGSADAFFAMIEQMRLAEKQPSA